jgi:hypothetical protein
MSEVLILIIIVAAVLAFFNREWIKNRFFPEKHTNYTIDDQFNSDKRDREKEIDRLLSKMGKNGSMTFRQKTEKT